MGIICAIMKCLDRVADKVSDFFIDRFGIDKRKTRERVKVVLVAGTIAVGILAVFLGNAFLGTVVTGGIALKTASTFISGIVLTADVISGLRGFDEKSY
jgi:hypothetical protein